MPTFLKGDLMSLKTARRDISLMPEERKGRKGGREGRGETQSRKIVEDCTITVIPSLGSQNTQLTYSRSEKQ